MPKLPTASASGDRPQMASAWDLFPASARVIGRNFWTLAGLFAIPLGGFVLTIAALYILEKTHASASLGAIVGLLLAVGSIASLAIVLPAATLTLLKGARGERVEIQEMLNAARPLMWRYLAVSILLVTLCMLGIVALIIPYFIVLKFFVLAPYYVIDQNVSPIEAFRRSAADSKKYSSAMWGIVGILLCFDLVEFVPHVGTVASIVFALFYAAAPAVRYVEIRDAEDNPSAKKKTRKTARKRTTFADQFDGKSTI